jgi:hypothetical protein
MRSHTKRKRDKIKPANGCYDNKLKTRTLYKSCINYMNGQLLYSGKFLRISQLKVKPQISRNTLYLNVHEQDTI